MAWWRRWFGPAVRLLPAHSQRLAAWKALPAPSLSAPVLASRYVVVDVETTGLDLGKDRLISIGAVAVVEGKVALGDSFYVVLQQREASDKRNILLHGIGAAAQREGEPPVEALLTFLEYLGKSPLIAFHVTFDETMIRRALREHLGLNLKHPWLDLAYVMPALHPRLAHRCRALDDWIARFGIRIDVRHNALADALATAQLFQVAYAEAARQGMVDMAALRGLEQAQRWVGAMR